MDIDNVKVTAELDNFEQKIQDVLIDLTFRGDNCPSTRRFSLMI
ncbi:hypothetical protein BN134_1621 [Cronobacter dublinensis 1210]|uniref:Uncharacterized protein n=1 Tax=Cronobacter dublinensis 1210 TaxID=1208656 RepID=A0ABM9Q611_9ENTR|nr:hypothetical protein BN134_1621 [Cronobacter dublinensis 1210]